MHNVFNLNSTLHKTHFYAHRNYYFVFPRIKTMVKQRAGSKDNDTAIELNSL